MKPDKKYYQILGVAITANRKEIQDAYHKLAKKFHPDPNPNNKNGEEQFKKIAEAWEIISKYFKKHPEEDQINNEKKSNQKIRKNKSNDSGVSIVVEDIYFHVSFGKKEKERINKKLETQ